MYGSNHHELQQLLLGALVQVGLFDGHRLASRDVASHVHLAQIIEAPSCDTVSRHEVNCTAIFFKRYLTHFYAWMCVLTQL